MLERRLPDDEIHLIRAAEAFVRENHRNEGGHDHAHVLAVTDYALRVADRTPEPADPFVVAMGALFHDLGRIGADNGIMHGLRGAAIAREWLHSTDVPVEVREHILRAVARHTPTTAIPPQSVEERIVYDADALDRLGIMGMLRGLIGKRGSTEAIVEDRIQKRLGDYDRLHFAVSRSIGEALHADTLTVVERFREALKKEVRQLHRIPWPVPDGMDVPVTSLSNAVNGSETHDLGAALASVESQAEVDRPAGDDGLSPEVRAGSLPQLSTREAMLVQRLAAFVRANQQDLKAHDFAHVLTVVKNAIVIARTVPEPVDPMVLLCGALLHDIGWIGAERGAEHGLRGASIANELLASTSMSDDVRARVRRVVVRHSLSSGQAPETVEERIVWDADGLAGVGLIGVLRGIISGVGAMNEIIEACLRYAGKRAEDLHFDESRRMADELSSDAELMIRRFLAALRERQDRVSVLRLPT